MFDVDYDGDDRGNDDDAEDDRDDDDDELTGYEYLQMLSNSNPGIIHPDRFSKICQCVDRFRQTIDSKCIDRAHESPIRPDRRRVREYAGTYTSTNDDRGNNDNADDASDDDDDCDHDGDNDGDDSP